MIEHRKGNLFSSYELPCVIVHGANAQGRMGSGFAKEFRAAFPEAYLDYVQTLKYTLGQVITTEYDNLTVCSAITQEFYGYDNKQYVSYGAVREALTKVAKHANGWPIYMPFIGGGLGGGNREKLIQIFEEVFQDSRAYVYTLA